MCRTVRSAGLRLRCRTLELPFKGVPKYDRRKAGVCRIFTKLTRSVRDVKVKAFLRDYRRPCPDRAELGLRQPLLKFRRQGGKEAVMAKRHTSTNRPPPSQIDPRRGMISSRPFLRMTSSALHRLS